MFAPTIGVLDLWARIQSEASQVKQKNKNTVTARYLSIIPGLGQMYVGRYLRGIIFFFVMLMTLPIGIGFLIWIWCFRDAGEVADLHNQRAFLKTVEKSN